MAPNDKRFTFTREYAGYDHLRTVARFCGDFIGSAATPEEAKALALAYDTDTIHVAYSISRGCGTSYLARAYVVRRGLKHTYTTGIGDTADEAMREAVAYVAQTYARERLEAPTSIVYHGKRSAAVVDAREFHRELSR